MPCLTSEPPTAIDKGAKLESGRIVAVFSRRYLVERGGGTLIPCMPRGRSNAYACGDRVSFAMSGADQGLIDAAVPRSSLFVRSDHYRTKLIAANVTQILVLVAAEPSFSLEFVDRALVAAKSQRIPALIACNKIDLLPQASAALAALQPYRAIGYPVIEFAAKRDCAPLRPHLQGQVTLLLGQSGMGKSTLVNALIPDAGIRVGEVSAALATGRHTTTSTTLYPLPAIDADAWIVDSPGMKAFGLSHLDPSDIAEAFVELRPLLGTCRFRDCRHDAEPDCAIQAAVRAGRVAPHRVALMHAMLRDARAARDPAR